MRTSAEYIHRVNMMIDLEVDEVDQHNFLNEKVSHLEDQMRSLQRPDACLQVINPSQTKFVAIILIL